MSRVDLDGGSPDRTVLHHMLPAPVRFLHRVHRSPRYRRRQA